MSDENTTTTTLDEEEIYRYRLMSYERAFWDHMSRLRYACREGYRKGYFRGTDLDTLSEEKRKILTKDFEQGFEKSFAEREKSDIMEFTDKHLVSNIRIYDIIELTGLSFEEILGILDEKRASAVIHEVKVKIAKDALRIKISIDKISEFTDLSVEEITKLSGEAL